ncbi:hypothetical protein M426DRAFT_317743 [Hypoxylon sp. CI-4A]|nr:hypothetical protein M426DRAFT_317743 [Hypoxylon sp. CI-4A]
MCGIKKRRPVKQRYAATIPFAMKRSLQNRQLNSTTSRPNYSERHPSQDTTTSGDHDAQDDMYLFDIATQPPPVLDSGHVFITITDELTTTTLEKFLSEVWLCYGSLSEEEKVVKLREQLRVHNKCNINPEHKNENCRDPTPLSVPSISLGRHFACPLYVYNPEKHFKCFTRANLVDIKDVKQHLWNAHQLPPYCPICCEVFTSMIDCNDHIWRRSCSPRGTPHPDGITMQQMQQLARRTDVRMSTDLQWLSIWEIVFPSAGFPTVDYPSSTMEYMVCLFQDYWLTQGEKIATDFLEDKGFRNYKSQGEEHNCEALHITVLHRVIDRLVEGLKYDNTSNTDSGKAEQVFASLRHLRLQ